MPNYTELASGYKLVENETGVSGRRVFIDDSGGSDTSLPKHGDFFDTDNRDLLLREIVKTNYGDDARIKKYEMTYEAKPADESNIITVGSGASGFNQLPKNVEVGGEFLTVTPEGGMTFADSGAPVEQRVPVRVAVGKLVVPKVIYNFDTLFDLVIDSSGTVNSSTFFNRASEIWLLEGAKFTEFRDHQRRRRWKVDLHFAFRIATRQSGSGNDGWNYVLNKTTMGWEKTNPELYTTSNFNLLGKA